jgi:hypothetical protein
VTFDSLSCAAEKLKIKTCKIRKQGTNDATVVKKNNIFNYNELLCFIKKEYNDKFLKKKFK